MYIFKNALKCISRSKSRNFLIGIIVFVIAISACLGLSIRQAANTAREDTLEGLSVTATISFDRQSMMGNMGSEPGSFNKDDFQDMMGKASTLSLEEYQTYAQANSVKDFYYSMTSSLNGSDSLEAVSSESESDTDSEENSNSMENGFPGMMGGMMGGMIGTQGDFSIVGYSDDSAMTSFIDGSASISEGIIFEEGSSAYECIISEELAIYNDISVDDDIKITNPNNEEEIYTLKVVGIYTDTSTNTNSDAYMFGSTNSDPANKIYMSYNALAKMIEESKDVATTEVDEITGMEMSTAIMGNLNATYSFANVEDYEAFEAEARALGLDESYSISSSDVMAYENSLTPLNTLSTMATTFLFVILTIGAIILVVLNIFNVRERKYEIGVLMAMGMKKAKVAFQFLTEIFIVTMIAVVIGAGIGAVCAVPVTNALLADQIESGSIQQNEIEQNFGRPQMGGMPQSPPNEGGFEFFGAQIDGVEYISEIDSAMNLTVVVQMLGIAVLLTLIAGCASMTFVMRYEPLKILANRD